MAPSFFLSFFHPLLLIILFLASPGSFGFSSSPPPTRGASVLSMSMSTGAPQVEKLSEITDLTIPAHVKYGGQLYFVFQFTISKREEGRKEEGEEGGGSEIAGKKTKVTFSVLRTPEEIRSFARLIKVRRLKVYNKNLRKRSNHTVNKKRMEVCCRSVFLSFPFFCSSYLSSSE